MKSTIDWTFVWTDQINVLTPQGRAPAVFSEEIPALGFRPNQALGALLGDIYCRKIKTTHP